MLIGKINIFHRSKKNRDVKIHMKSVFPAVCQKSTFFPVFPARMIQQAQMFILYLRVKCCSKLLIWSNYVFNSHEIKRVL